MALADAAQSTENIITLLLQAADRLRSNGDKEAACCMIDFVFMLLSQNCDKASSAGEIQIPGFGPRDLGRLARNPRQVVLT